MFYQCSVGLAHHPFGSLPKLEQCISDILSIVFSWLSKCLERENVCGHTMSMCASVTEKMYFVFLLTFNVSNRPTCFKEPYGRLGKKQNISNASFSHSCAQLPMCLHQRRE